MGPFSVNHVRFPVDGMLICRATRNICKFPGGHDVSLSTAEGGFSASISHFGPRQYFDVLGPPSNSHFGPQQYTKSWAPPVFYVLDQRQHGTISHCPVCVCVCMCVDGLCMSFHHLCRELMLPLLFPIYSHGIPNTKHTQFWARPKGRGPLARPKLGAHHTVGSPWGSLHPHAAT